jgi:hypothetical protein
MGPGPTVSGLGLALGGSVLTPQEQSDLLSLGYRWAENYALSVTEGTWIARPAENSSAAITAPSAVELGEKLLRDYADRHPVTSDGVLHERTST